MAGDAGGVRLRGCAASSTTSPETAPRLTRCGPTGLKQLLKNGVYRAIGETVTGVGGLERRGRARRSACSCTTRSTTSSRTATTVPTAVFAEQMALLGELGYVPVVARAGARPLRRRRAAPAGAVLITFDDGYRDNLENALPILQRHGYPAVIFVPIGFSTATARLPHEETLRALGVRNPTRELGRARGARGGRHPRRVARDRAPAASPSSSRPRRRARSRSKLRLEERLGGRSRRTRS
mgnify:CR=1 FL=1